MTSWALKKFQYGYHGKNGKVSGQTERTYWEYYSITYFYFKKYAMNGITEIEENMWELFFNQTLCLHWKLKVLQNVMDLFML